MTMPLLQPEILLEGELIGSEHRYTDAVVISVYNETMLNTRVGLYLMQWLSQVQLRDVHLSTI